MRKFISLFFITFLLVGYAISDSLSQKPKLVVLIVIDQFRYDYVTRMADQFTGGFRYFLDQGAFYTNAQFDYACTYTAPGHACIATGTTPDKNGIVANDWYDRSLKRDVYACEDSTSPLWKTLELTNKENRPLTKAEGIAGRSPRKLLVSTFGDALKLSNNNQSKVFSISHKDRSAIMMGGHLSNGSFWVDRQTGEFTSSAYYGTKSPEWLTAFNKSHPVTSYFGKDWNRLLPETAYSISRPDNDPAENDPEFLGITFPHPIRGRNNKPDASFVAAFLCTPYSNDYLVQLAETIVKEEKLGQRNVPDVLCVSFSANDAAGHSYGPNSQEMQDFTLWTDKYMGDLFNFLDKTIGLNNTVIFLSADHGVCPLPEILKEMGYDSGRIKSSVVVETINKALKDTYSFDNMVESFSGPCIYLDYAKLNKPGISLEEIQDKAAKSLENIPQVKYAFTQTHLMHGEYPQNEVAQRFARSCMTDRSGDVFVGLQPYWYFGTPGSKGTTHGTVYMYDTHVPILAVGKNITHGNFSRLVGIEDIAPTIAQILQVEMNTSNQREILYEVLPTHPSR